MAVFKDNNNTAVEEVSSTFLFYDLDRNGKIVFSSSDYHFLDN